MLLTQQTVTFTAKEKAELITSELEVELTGSQVLLKLIYDVISTGTELANYRDSDNISIAENSTKGKFPRVVGYSFTAEVIATGPEVKNLVVGDKVIVGWGGHRKYIVKNESALLKVPAGVDLKDAALTHIASFPMLGVRKLRIQLGESCMVAGLGLLGLLAVQFAKLSGAYPVIACDFSEERRKIALALGADHVLDPGEAGFIGKVRSLTEGQGVDCTVEVTGFMNGFQQALEYTAVMGRISILGCTRISDQPINIYKYIHGKGIEIYGAHTRTRPKQESGPVYWTEMDDYKTFLKLLAANKVNVKPILTREVSPLDAGSVYNMLNTEKNPPLGVVFNWAEL